LTSNGSFTISLDFELYWGVRDKRALEDYKNNLDGVWSAIPQILKLFEKYQIHATWATVGFLFFKNKNELKKNLPSVLPNYKNKDLSPYEYFLSFEIDIDNKYHFANELIYLIKNTNGQEIASHTFSHFYTMEEYSQDEAFFQDTLAFRKKTKIENIDLKSIVFPRNQVAIESLACLKDTGINIYRGNPNHWAYKDGDVNKDFKTKVFRLLDTYINISGHKTSKVIEEDGIYNIKSSMFLRPYSKKFAILKSLKLRRIKKAMLYAAKSGENFHLWWHPHNFGVNQEKNFKNLIEILEYYKVLEVKYGMKSKNMKELTYA